MAPAARYDQQMSRLDRITANPAVCHGQPTVRGLRVPVATLLELLAPDFRGVVADGMPRGLGGTYDGPQAMLSAVWGPVSEDLDVTPVPAEYLDAGHGRVVVVGRYRGAVRATGDEIDAAFAHVLRIEEDRVAELVQITDTARWHAALAS